MVVSHRGWTWHFRRLVVLPIVAFILAGPAQSSENDITVFAAASTTEVVKALVIEFERRTGGEVTASFAGSSTLAKQIEQGAPANIFISANQQWLTYLKDRGMMSAGSPIDIATNKLVVIAPKGAPIAEPFELADLPKLIGNGFLAIGNPDHVPAGIYAKTALQSLDLWKDLQDRYVQMPNVRAVLTLVERDEVVAGIVYETDARLSKNLKVIAVVPSNVVPELTYGMAMLKGYDSHMAKLFFDFVRSPEGQDIFARFGFGATPN
jgi:molybdate transport system substrate-binding protein